MVGERPARGRHTPCANDCRCACGSLLARVVDGAVELKCRRCKRTHRVALVADPMPARLARALPLGEAG
ncbi:MAG: hypothetical protein E4H11_01830 [Myxococcales bacterium]|nr:MAG: hypothetical protein E4H11_01830 [Myxococcales bacterium]